MFVGGEFYEDDRWDTSTPTLSMTESTFLNGGRACLGVISDYLYANNITRVLLPSYLCPSIMDVLDQNNLQYDFYRVNPDLSIDLEDLERMAANTEVVYFINYFGFQHSESTRVALRDLQRKDVLLIEDNAQAGFVRHTIGDFSFNSMRKFTAYDGGYLTSPIDLSAYLEKYAGRVNHRLPVIRAYRKQLPAYLFEGRGRRADLERLFHQAEAFYEKDDVVIGDEQERVRIEKMDWESIKMKRRDNYNYLLGLLKNNPEIIPLYPALQEGIMPMGMPLYVNNVSRDRLCELLAEESISLTVHWDALLDDPRLRQFPSTQAMAARMVTLPIDQYTDHAQLEYLAEKISEIVMKLQ